MGSAFLGVCLPGGVSFPGGLPSWGPAFLRGSAFLGGLPKYVFRVGSARFATWAVTRTNTAHFRGITRFQHYGDVPSREVGYPRSNVQGLITNHLTYSHPGHINSPSGHTYPMPEGTWTRHAHTLREQNA